MILPFGLVMEWRERPLGAYPYVFLDAHYEKSVMAG